MQTTQDTESTLKGVTRRVRELNKGTVDPVLLQVSVDIDAYLKPSVNPKKTLKFISKKIGVHEKTLFRVWTKANRPTYTTVFRLYKFLFSEVDDSKVLARAPEVIRDYLNRANPQKLEKSVSYTSDIEKEVLANPVMAEIYVLCGTGALTKKEVQERFGTYGVRVVEQMLKLKILTQNKPDQFILGSAQMNMSPELVLSLGQQIAASYSKPKNSYEVGDNFLAFYAEGLSEEAYDKWLSIDKEAFDKKITLAQSPGALGTKKAFTFTCIDTLIARNDHEKK